MLGCAGARGLTSAVSIVASGDGRNVYTVSGEATGAVGIFRRLR